MAILIRETMAASTAAAEPQACRYRLLLVCNAEQAQRSTEATYLLAEGFKATRVRSWLVAFVENTRSLKAARSCVATRGHTDTQHSGAILVVAQRRDPFRLVAALGKERSSERKNVKVHIIISAIGDATLRSLTQIILNVSR